MDRLSHKCKELGIPPNSFDFTRRGSKKTQEVARKARLAMEADLANLGCDLSEEDAKGLRQVVEAMLVDSIMAALLEK